MPPGKRSRARPDTEAMHLRAGIQVISGILLQHQLDAEFDGGDELLRLNSASVCGLLEAVNGLAELVELRLGRVLRQKTHGSMETD